MTTIYSSFFIRGGYMKSLKEFKPLIKLIGQDKNKLVLASILIFISGIAEIFTGYLMVLQ